jgi:hypothetical protein
MNRLILHLVLFILLLNSACSEDNYEGTNRENFQFSGIQIKGDYTVSLPENAINLESIQIIDSDDGYFLIGNSAINGLQFLDKQGKVLKQILVSEIRMADFQNSLQYVLYHNSDSIFILNNNNGLLINNKGELIQQFSYNKKQSGSTHKGIHMASGFKPHYYNGCLYFNSELAGHEKDLGFLFRFSLSTLQLDLLFDYPEVFKSGYWVAPGYDRFFSILIPEKGAFLFSFPWEKHLYLYQLSDGNFRRIEGAPAHIPDIKAPFQSFEERLASAYTEPQRRAYLQFEFSSLILDPNRNLIYRIMEHPLTDNEISSLGNTPFYLTRNFQVLVFDGDSFEFLGESEVFPKGSHIKTRYFVNDEGLFLEQVQKNPDEIQFTKLLAN